MVILHIGHLRPLCAFVGKVAKERSDISMTFLTVGDYTSRIQSEISRYVGAIPNNIRSVRTMTSYKLSDGLIPVPVLLRRVVQIGGETNLDPLQLQEVMFQVFPERYDKLVRCEPIQCQATGTNFPAIRSPTLVIIDVRMPVFLFPISVLKSNAMTLYSCSSFRSSNRFGLERVTRFPSWHGLL
jgi:hypothetical protein